MKAAIYLEGSTTQVVLTPENEWERSALKMISQSNAVQTFWGKFYECQGGWLRQGQAYGGYDSKPLNDTSLMFRIDKRIEDAPMS